MKATADGMNTPTMRLLSLGAGVQSTVLALMACDGTLPGLDGAIFADTGWEPRRVYDHLGRLEVELNKADIPLYRVAQGNLREDSINPDHRFASVPYFVRNAPYAVQDPVEFGPCECRNRDYTPKLGGDIPLPGFDPAPGDPDPLCVTCGGSGQVETKWRERPATLAERQGMGRRQCTSEYKLAPIGRKVRELLGAEAPDFRRVPRGQVAEQWIGFSTDEVHRVSDKDGVSYSVKRYPLLELGMSRSDCQRWLTDRGWGSTAKSACIGCPFHGNSQWRDLRDNHPDEWADAVAFDEAIRKGGARGLPLNGEAFLHRSRVPLSIAPIDRQTRNERRSGVVDVFDLLAEQGDPDGCSPYGCRSGEAVLAA